jgi:hypothetical protein
MIGLAVILNVVGAMIGQSNWTAGMALLGAALLFYFIGLDFLIAAEN